jgi:hypothetical protein
MDTKNLAGWKDWKMFFKRQFNISFIPDVKEYKCVVGDWDKDFESILIKKRSWRRAEITMYKNRKYNKYLTYLYKCIWNWRFDPIQRAKYTIFLLQSRTGFIAALQHVEPHWYTKPKSTIDRVFKKHRKNGDILKVRDFDYKRVYIPKGDKWRPLGVPKLWERTSLHLITKVLMFILEPHLKASQHGLTTRGTKTAWREVLTRAIKWENIYEYDLKGFFDNVNNLLALMRIVGHYWDKMAERARTYKMEIQSFMFELLKNTTGFDKVNTQGILREDFLFKFIARINETRPKWPEKSTKEQIEGDVVRTRERDRIGIYHEKVLQDLVSGTLGHTRKGVPQGAPHSPLIAMVGKTVYSGKYPWEKEELQNHIEYVDDGITDKEVKSNPESGTMIQPLKSGWVKQEGRWIKPLKFLGLTYNGQENLLFASTRNGASLKFEGPVVEVIKKKLRIQGLDWDKITSSKYWGWIMSRLYQDSWIDSKYIRRQWLIHGAKSWIERVESILIDRIHSQSIKRHLIDRCKWKDPRDGTQVTETNMSSICANIFMDKKIWDNIKVDRDEEYRRMYIEAAKSGNRINPIIIKNHRIYDGEREYSRWKEYKKYLRKGLPLTCRLDTWIGQTGVQKKVFSTLKVTRTLISTIWATRKS